MGERCIKCAPGTRIYDLLCCLAIRPQLFEFFQKDSIPLFGDDEDVKIIDSVLSYIHKEDTDVEETIDIISFLDKGGWNSLAQQVRQGINGHFLRALTLKQNFTHWLRRCGKNMARKCRPLVIIRKIQELPNYIPLQKRNQIKIKEFMKKLVVVGILLRSRTKIIKEIFWMKLVRG